MIAGLVTAVLLVTFLGITVWAWSGRNCERFEHAARSPLADEKPACCRHEDAK